MYNGKELIFTGDPVAAVIRFSTTVSDVNGSDNGPEEDSTTVAIY